MPSLSFTSADALALERRGLRDRVYDLVLSMLMSRDVEPGTRLSIDQMARDLKVSPTPVREALVQLERTGLVTRVAHKGYRVAPPLDEAQLHALFDARAVLEPGAAALAVGSATPVVPALEAALERQEEVARRVQARVGEDSLDLVGEFFEADWAFHRILFDGTGNAFLRDMSETISTRVHRMRQHIGTGITDSAEAIAEHRSVLDAFAAGPDAAAAAMREHIERVRARSLADHRRR